MSNLGPLLVEIVAQSMDFCLRRNVLKAPLTDNRHTPSAWPKQAARERAFVRLLRLLSAACEAQLEGAQMAQGVFDPVLPDELAASVTDRIEGLLQIVDSYFTRDYVYHRAGQVHWLNDPRTIWDNQDLWVVLDYSAGHLVSRVFDVKCRLSPQVAAFVGLLARYGSDSVPSDVLRTQLHWESDHTRWRVIHELNRELMDRRSLAPQVRSRAGDLFISAGFRARLAVIEKNPETRPNCAS